MKISKISSRYVYFIDTGTMDNGKNCFISMFDSIENDVVKYCFYNKVIYNGSVVNDSDAVELIKRESQKKESGVLVNYMDMEKIDYCNVKQSAAAQVARVTVVDNFVVSIITIDRNNIGNVLSDTSGLKKFFDLDRVGYMGSGNFDNRFYIDYKTVVIYVPSDRNDEENYTCKSASVFLKNNIYWMEAYNVNSSKTANLVLVYNRNVSSKRVDGSSVMNVVGSEGFFAENNGEQTYVVKYYPALNIPSVSCTASDEAESFSMLQPGDMFQAGHKKDETLWDLIGHVRLKYSDISEVLNENYDETNGIYSWNNSIFSSKSPSKYNGNPFWELNMYNVLTVDDYNRVIRLTNGGFYKKNDERGIWTGEYEICDDVFNVSVPDDITFFRYDRINKHITPYAENNKILLDFGDLHSFDEYGILCNKIALYKYKNAVKMIVVYE